MESQGTLNNQNKFEKELTFPDFKTYCIAMVINTVWYWCQDRKINQQESIEIPEINPCIYGQMIFDKGAKATSWEKDSVFENGLRKTCKRMQLDLYFIYKN